MIAGIAVAVAAAVSYQSGYIVQAMETRREGGGERLEAALLARLIRRWRWTLSMCLTGGGAALQVLALSMAPVVAVQATLALGLVLLLGLAATFLGERIGWREAAAVAAIVCGVTAVALLAPSNEVSDVDLGWTVAVLGILASALFLPFALRDRVRDPRLRVLAASSGDAAAAISLALIAEAVGDGRFVATAIWAICAGTFGLTALTAEMSALQRVAATHVAPPLLAGQVLVPVVTAPLVLGQAWPDGVSGPALGVAVLMVTSGAALLGSSGAIADVVAGGGASQET